MKNEWNWMLIESNLNHRWESTGFGNWNCSRCGDKKLGTFNPERKGCKGEINNDR